MYSRKKLGGEPNAICEYSFDNNLYMYLQWENKIEKYFTGSKRCLLLVNKILAYIHSLTCMWVN